MKVALVHDDIVQWGGAEKVLLELTQIFPDAPIYTSVIDYSNPLIKQKFTNKKIITSFLQKIPLWKLLYKPMLPLYPIAFEQFNFDEYDVVISQTTRFAKAIITKPHTIHICYCHTPPRFLYDLPADKNPRILKFFLEKLRTFDQVSKNRVDYWIGGSKNCTNRLKKIYNVDSETLQPFVDESLINLASPFSGGYYLLIARLNGYKNVELAVKCFNENGKKLIIVGKGPMLDDLKFKSRDNIRFFTSVSDQLLASFLAGCRGLIITAEEDFGMTSLEAQLFGKGVVAYGRGGALETIVENKTGVFFEELSVSSLQKAIDKFENLKIVPQDCINNTLKFSRSNFKSKLLSILKRLQT